MFVESHEESALVGKEVMLNGRLRNVDSSKPGVIIRVIRGRPQVRFVAHNGDPCQWGVDWSMIREKDPSPPAHDETQESKG